MDGEIRIGVLGLGRMGQYHCRTVTGTPGLKLVAGSSRSQQLRSKVEAEHAIGIYDDHEALLRNPEVDWVVVATTTEKHVEWALKAIQHGKNIIVEKPIALSLEETRQIVSAAEQAKVRVTVYNSRRWDADFRFIRGIMEGGELGEVYRLESRYTDFNPGWGAWGAEGEKNPWRLKQAYGGGLLNDWGPHLFDQILLLVDSPLLTVFAKLYKKIWSEEVEDHFISELVFKNGISALVEASNNHRIAQSRWCVVGTEGTCWVQGGAPHRWNSAIVRRGSQGKMKESKFTIDGKELSFGFYRDFAKAIHSGMPLSVQPAEVMQVMEVIEAVRHSDSLHRHVRAHNCCRKTAGDADTQE